MTTDQKTKIQIWQAFRDEFIQEGINSADEMSFRHKIPSAQELGNSHSILKKIGRFKRFTIWLVRSAVHIGSAIIMYTEMPGAMQKIRTRHPRTFKAVDDVGKAIQSYSDRKPGQPVSKENGKYINQYVVFNDAWRNNKTQYLNEVEALNSTGKISDGSILVPGGKINISAIISTDASISLSDFT